MRLIDVILSRSQIMTMGIWLCHEVNGKFLLLAELLSMCVNLRIKVLILKLSSHLYEYIVCSCECHIVLVCILQTKCHSASMPLSGLKPLRNIEQWDRGTWSLSLVAPGTTQVSSIPSHTVHKSSWHHHQIHEPSVDTIQSMIGRANLFRNTRAPDAAPCGYTSVPAHFIFVLGNISINLKCNVAMKGICLLSQGDQQHAVQCSILISCFALRIFIEQNQTDSSPVVTSQGIPFVHHVL